MQLTDLFHPLTAELVDSFKGHKSFIVDPHDKEDPESADWLWIKKYFDGGMSEGEYLSISPSHPNSKEWFVSHKAADICGGHPTFWSKSGSFEELLKILPSYIIERAKALN